jgi:hypothetical protein
MKRPLIVVAVLVVTAVGTRPTFAQSTFDRPQQIPPAPKTVSLAGPRFGFTFLDDGIVEKLKTEDIEVKNGISQFGWQFERQFYSKEGGPTVLNEWVVLVGGLDQGVALPSVNWLVGLRTREGAEFGIGPNITPVGVALAMAAGVTVRTGIMNIPMTFAVVPSKEGMRVSMLTGFTLRR